MTENRPPVTGYNHNIKHIGWEFHVQTEDSGVQNPHIITHLFHRGTILATKKLVYAPDSDPEFVKTLMQAQHKAVLKELKAGKHDERIKQVLGGKDAAAAPAEAAPASPPPDATAPPPERAVAPAAAETEEPARVPEPANPTPTALAPVVEVAPAADLAPEASSLPPTPERARAESMVATAPMEWNLHPATWDPLPPMLTPVEPEEPQKTPRPFPAGLPPPPAAFLHRSGTKPMFSMPPERDAAATGPPLPPFAQPAPGPMGGMADTAPFVSNPPPAGSTTYEMRGRVSETVNVPAAPGRSSTSPRLLINAGTEVEVEFEDAEALKAAWMESGPAGGLLLDPDVAAGLGQEVQLRVRVEGAGHERLFSLRGRVAWRRLKGRGSLRAGTGIEFLAADKEAAARLHAFAEGRHVEDAQDRAHSREQVVVQVRVVDRKGNKRQETVDDISEGGLFIKTTDLLPVGEELTLTLRPPHGLFRTLDVRGRVTWHRPEPEAGMGVMFLFDSPDHQEKVEQLVTQLIAAEL